MSSNSTLLPLLSFDTEMETLAVNLINSLTSVAKKNAADRQIFWTIFVLVLTFAVAFTLAIKELVKKEVARQMSGVYGIIVFDEHEERIFENTTNDDLLLIGGRMMESGRAILLITFE
ncbi:unnamed protein product [Caenorhabditis auriculariae]|uniref:Uncharacterized protein n=1 Tax=Caenorhabditis auriculariae TaxID=2777116 RepID=A0A8S1GR35_9PELO|nr:unnamed protein product [Caenorhabditis auriculariae]